MVYAAGKRMSTSDNKKAASFEAALRKLIQDLLPAAEESNRTEAQEAEGNARGFRNRAGNKEPCQWRICSNALPTSFGSLVSKIVKGFLYHILEFLQTIRSFRSGTAILAGPNLHRLCYHLRLATYN